MTYEKAVEIMNCIIELGEAKKENMQAERIAVLALEKQISKAPDFIGDGYDDSGNIILDTWICPCCNADFEVDYNYYNYCPMCGQMIDWSGHDDE